ncbi:MAG: PDDEXK nuclease domain-containing protein [Opitutaceae bacterium]
MNSSNFQKLIVRCEQTHQLTRSSAARATNQALVIRNFLLGRYIVEFEQEGSNRAEYGESLLLELSNALKSSLGRGFSVDNLEWMRRFYIAYSKNELLAKSEKPSRISGNQISETLSRISAEDISDSQNPSVQQISRLQSELNLLSWSHYVALLSISNLDERSFYEIESAANDWSLRELKRQINSSLFERLALSRDKDQVNALAQQGQIVEQAADLIKNPYVLEFLGLDERTTYSESELETAIIDKLEHFLLELGKGFLFEARQKRFTFDEDHYFIDLVFYNRLLRCYALIDLKIGEISHQDLGQMQMYVNYYDRHVKTDAEAPTIGIVLCKRKKDALVEITLPKDSNIHASEYKLYLPSKDELIAQIDQATEQMEDQS